MTGKRRGRGEELLGRGESAMVKLGVSERKGAHCSIKFLEIEVETGWVLNPFQRALAYKRKDGWTHYFITHNTNDTIIRH